MKRINLTIILAMMLVILFPITSLASGVGSAGEVIGVVEGTKIDPRYDSRYAEKYNFSASETNGLKFYDDIVINYHSYQNDKIYGLNAYGRIYSSQERFCFYLENTRLYGNNDYYDLKYILVENEQTLLTYSYSQKDGLFNFEYDKAKQEATNTVAQKLDYYRQEGFEIVECSVPVFSNYDDAILYINTGEIRNAIINPNENKNIPADITAEQIYLDDFQVIYHDAPSLDDCYIEFKYSIPRHLRNARKALYLGINSMFKLNIRAMSGISNVTRDFSGFEVINVSEHPYGFSLFISNISAVQEAFVGSPEGETLLKRQILGNEFYGLDFDNFSIGGIGLVNIAAVTQSEISFDLSLSLGRGEGGKKGTKYTAFVDFLNLENCYYDSSKYNDTSQDYTPNNDTKKDGYYSTDGKGNYNYHSSTGDTQTITSYDYDNSTNSTQYITNNYYGGGGGGSGGGNGTLTDLAINIGDIIFNIDIGSIGGNDNSGSLKDYLLPDSTLGALKTGFGFLDNPETEQKGDGFISFLGSFYSFLSDDFTKIIMFGIAVIVVLGILSIVMKVVF